jgi:hypothetical protein
MLTASRAYIAILRPCWCTASSFSSSATATTKSINTSSRLIIDHLRGGGIGIKRICHHDNINSSSSRHQYNSISSFSSSSLSSSKSLKKVIRPFLVACHPDLMHATTTTDNEEGITSTSNKRQQQQHHLSIKAREVNLKAVQIINGLIDNLEDLIGRCVPPCYSDGDRNNNNKSVGSLPELKARYEIEFILPSSEDNSSNNSNGPIKKKRYKERREALTLRSITMEFPESLRSSVRQWALTSFPDTSSSSSSSKYTNPDYEPHPQEQESYRVAMQLRQHATAEFVRLLTISGMEVPRSSALDGMMHGGDKSSRVSSKAKEESQWTLSDHFLHEIGINPMEDVVDPSSSPSQKQGTTSAFFGRMQQPRQHSPSYSTKMQQQRQAFMSKIPWEKFRTNYDQAFLDAQADCTTSNLKLFNPKTVEGRERRERLVSQICSNVRILRVTETDDVDSSEFDDDIPEGLDVVQQLIAIRRLNLILYDNFDYLQMERMGRMWENLGIVLLPPRENRRGGGGGGAQRRKKDPRHANAIIHPGRKLNKWERRMKRRQRLEPVSRGQMRYIADQHFSKISRKESDDVEDGEAEDEKQAQQYYVEPESGFKFSYGTRADQGTGHVTAHIPVDFGDDELVRQLYSHLYDYFDNCCGDMGFLSYGADGEVNANLTKDFERENVSRTRGASTEGKVDTERVA